MIIIRLADNGYVAEIPSECKVLVAKDVDTLLECVKDLLSLEHLVLSRTQHAAGA